MSACIIDPPLNAVEMAVVEDGYDVGARCRKMVKKEVVAQVSTWYLAHSYAHRVLGARRSLTTHQCRGDEHKFHPSRSP